MKKTILTTLCLLSAIASGAQPTKDNLESRKAFCEERFGIFLHWGIYSMLGQGEWVMQVNGIPQAEYSRLAAGFNPSKFNADEWVRAIKGSGARYITFTSRHHDGFSMFKSNVTPYNVVDATPFGRDILGELSAACHSEGIRLNLYYSHLDWGRDDYWPLGDTGHSAGRPEGNGEDWNHYMEFINAQLTELLTNYGPIGAIWFDGIWDKESSDRDKQRAIWNLDEQYALVHSLQKGCLVGNNHHLEPFPGEDIQIFERDIPGRNEGGYCGNQGVSEEMPLETCQTMNNTWGYNITDTHYKSADDIIRYLVRTAGKGANLLLNIGPRPDGTLPDEALKRLEAIGKWMNIYGETIYGTSAGTIKEQSWGVTTQKGDTLYVHVLNPESKIFLNGIKARSAVSFTDGRSIPFERCKSGTILSIPESACSPDFVIKLDL